jgi:hypothetical protein
MLRASARLARPSGNWRAPAWVRAIEEEIEIQLLAAPAGALLLPLVAVPLGSAARAVRLASALV